MTRLIARVARSMPSLGAMAVAVAVLCGPVGTAWAVVQESLVEEKKPHADTVVQAEMKRIRDLTLDAHTLVTHRRMPVAEARKFRLRIEEAVKTIESGTTMAGDPREKLGALTQDLLTGAAAVAGADKTMDPIDGIMLIDDVLARYEDFFEHPGWQPLR